MKPSVYNLVLAIKLIIVKLPDVYHLGQFYQASRRQYDQSSPRNFEDARDHASWSFIAWDHPQPSWGFQPCLEQ